MLTLKLTPEIIHADIEGFEHQRTSIDAKIAELRAMLTGGSPEIAATPEAAPSKRKKFSAAARRRMKEAQQRRWAKVRGGSPTAAPEPVRPKRRLSAATKAKLVANLKKSRAAKAAKAKAGAKKAAPARKRSTAKKAVKKTATKKKAPAAAQGTTETGA